MCGEILPATAASPTQRRRRRRTSDGDRRLPRRDRNSAGSSSRATRAPAARSPDSARRARWAGSPIGTIRVFDPLPVTRSVSASKSGSPAVEADDLLGPQPARVGELEHGAVADLERRRAPGCGRAGPADLIGREHPRQRGVALRARQQLGGVLGPPRPPHEMVVEAPHRGELAADARLGEATLGQGGGVTAQVAVAQLTRRPASARRPEASSRDRSRRRAGRRRRRAAALELATEALQRLGPGRARLHDLVAVRHARGRFARPRRRRAPPAGPAALAQPM